MQLLVLIWHLLLGQSLMFFLNSFLKFYKDPLKHKSIILLRNPNITLKMFIFGRNFNKNVELWQFSSKIKAELMKDGCIQFVVTKGTKRERVWKKGEKKLTKCQFQQPLLHKIQMCKGAIQFHQQNCTQLYMWTQLEVIFWCCMLYCQTQKVT